MGSGPQLASQLYRQDDFYSGLAAWNTLPYDLHDITETSTFIKRLKSVVFDRAYN